MPATDRLLTRAPGTGRAWRGRLVRVGRRVLVLVTGAFLCLIGFVLLFLPGPGVPLVFAGLTVLASEFSWADRLLRLLRTKVRQLGRRPGRVQFGTTSGSR